MTPSFRCSNCEFTFRIDERFLGRIVVCPREGCGARIRLPQAGTQRLPSNRPRVLEPANRQNSTKNRKSVAERTEMARSARSSAERTNPPHPDTATRRTNSNIRRVRKGQTSTATIPGGRHITVGFVSAVAIGAVLLSGWWFMRPGAAVTDSTTIQTDMIQHGFRNLSGTTGKPENAIAAGFPQGVHSALRPDTVLLTSSTRLSQEELAKEAKRQAWVSDKAQPFFAKYCTDCHGPDEQSGGIAVDSLTSADQLLTERKKWERVYRMVNAGAMPPSGHDPFPSESEQKEIADFLYDELFNFDCSLVDHPGRPTIQRLNRAEYNNTIHDLFGLEITPADKFPQDDVGEGFDNIGDVLSLPPLLMEKYLDAAEEVVNAVVDLRDFSKPQTQTFRGNQLTSSLGTSADDRGFVMLQTNGEVSTSIDLPSDGKYLIRVENAAHQAGVDKPKMAVKLDDEVLFEYEINGGRRPEWHEQSIALPKGTHRISAAFLNDFFDANAEDGRKDRNAMVRTIEITGPEGGSEPQWHSTHRRFVTVRPENGNDIRSAARQVLRPILYRAFRRPVSDAEVDRFAALAERQVLEFNESYDYGISIALQAVLVAPDFIFRLEHEPEGNATQRILNEYEVASRLSYFLWSSMPDDELLTLAENRRLLDPNILRQQVARMLKDEKSSSLGVNFASQWLNLRNLKDVRPNPDLFPEFDDSLRTAMARETEVFFNTVVREDRSVDEFLLADFTFVNERLAKHYGMNGVSGDEFVRVSLGGLNRSGVLTHASILTLTSNPGRTSPVKRGKWIMENILGQAPPPAPPAVPELEATAKASPGLTLREQLALHRADPGCASCHKTMDPLGLGLENFDAVGRWREMDGEKPIDASGELPSGESFNGSLELISIFKDRREQFHRALAERMMVYALGRGLEYYDKCAIDKALDNMKARGYRFSSMIEGIVLSDPFLKRSLNRDATLTASSTLSDIQKSGSNR